jgi:hypothetical protein
MGNILAPLQGRPLCKLETTKIIAKSTARSDNIIVCRTL